MFVFQYHVYMIHYMDRKMQEGAASAFTAHKLLHRRAQKGRCKILAGQAHHIVCCPTVYKEQLSCHQLQVNTSGKCANAITWLQMPKSREKWAPTLHILMHCQVCSCMLKRGVDILLRLYSGTLVLPWATRAFLFTYGGMLHSPYRVNITIFFVRVLTSPHFVSPPLNFHI